MVMINVVGVNRGIDKTICQQRSRGEGGGGGLAPRKREEGRGENIISLV